MTDKTKYNSPLTSRYASSEMSFNFSDQNKFSLFRKLWVTLAKAQASLGLEQVTQEAIEQMEQNIDNIDWQVAAAEEKKRRHDVMAHVHTFGLVAPKG